MFTRGAPPLDRNCTGIDGEHVALDRRRVSPRLACASQLSISAFPGNCMHNTFFDMPTFCKPFATAAAGALYLRHLLEFPRWLRGASVVPVFVALILLALPSIRASLCVWSRAARPRMVRSFWGPAKGWLFMDVFFLFQTLQLNNYPHSGISKRLMYVLGRFAFFGLILGLTWIVYQSKSESNQPYAQQLVLIVFAFVVVFGFWLALYVDRCYLQAFTSTPKVILSYGPAGLSRFADVKGGLRAYQNGVFNGTIEVSDPGDSTRGVQDITYPNVPQHVQTTVPGNNHAVFTVERRDVLVSQVLLEARQRSIHIWTRIFSITGGVIACAIHSIAYFKIGRRSFLSGGVVSIVDGTGVLVSGLFIGLCVAILIATFGSTIEAYSVSVRCLHQMVREDSHDDEVFFSSTFHYLLHMFTGIWPLSMAKGVLERKLGYRLSAKVPLYLSSNVHAFLEMWREVVVQCQHDFAENSGPVLATLLAIIGFGGYLLYTWIEGVNPLERGPVLLDGLFAVLILFFLLLKASTVENYRDDVSICLQRWLEEVGKEERNVSELDTSPTNLQLKAALTGTYSALHEAKESIDGCDVVVTAWPGIPLDKRLLYSILSVLLTGIVKLGMSIAQSLREDQERQ
eukprot:gb/GECG01013159.1/.p1 GENE.gb/GECG01013159.1/~~gb/GECG01013159.1/.p1  ORF type:complete len:627 (+),score=25.98 gb/GECG01013159.1/:1-1881(+)